MNIEDFKHKTPIQIRFGDTDMLGHINNSNYLSYMELARMSYVNEVLKDRINWTKEGFIQANAIINFKLPLFVDDKVEVYVRVSKVGGKSMTMDYLFVKTDKTGKQSIAADGQTVLVGFDYRLNHSIAILDNWRTAIFAYEPSLAAI